MIGETVLLDEPAHATGAYAPQGAVVLEIPRDDLDALRRSKPNIF